MGAQPPRRISPAFDRSPAVLAARCTPQLLDQWRASRWQAERTPLVHQAAKHRWMNERSSSSAAFRECAKPTHGPSGLRPRWTAPRLQPLGDFRPCSLKQTSGLPNRGLFIGKCLNNRASETPAASANSRVVVCKSLLDEDFSSGPDDGRSAIFADILRLFSWSPSSRRRKLVYTHLLRPQLYFGHS